LLSGSYIPGMDLRCWTKALREAEWEFEAATTRNALNAAAKKLMRREIEKTESQAFASLVAGRPCRRAQGPVSGRRRTDSSPERICPAIDGRISDCARAPSPQASSPALPAPHRRPHLTLLRLFPSTLRELQVGIQLTTVSVAMLAACATLLTTTTAGNAQEKEKRFDALTATSEHDRALQRANFETFLLQASDSDIQVTVNEACLPCPQVSSVRRRLDPTRVFIACTDGNQWQLFFDTDDSFVVRHGGWED
jgi:hypothetical protein